MRLLVIPYCANHGHCNQPWTTFDTMVMVGLGISVALLVGVAVWFHRK